MNITDYCDAINRTLVVRYYQNQGYRWEACIEGAEVKQGDGLLGGVTGRGNTPEAAIAKYASDIAGKTIVIDAMLPSRQELQVPKQLNGSTGFM